VKTARFIITLFILIPFLFSVSGILVIHSHCSCTGKNQVTLYLPPETCSEILDDHKHLFNHHVDDLNHCCGDVNHENSCGEDDVCHDCGCSSPEVNFLKIKSQFTEEKASIAKLLPVKEVQEIDLLLAQSEIEKIKNINVAWLKDPPPAIPSLNHYIYFICQTKIPDIA